MTQKAAIIFAFFLLFTISPIFGQEIMWKAGFNSFFDNREYFNDYAQPGSLLGARTFAQGGFWIDEHNLFSIGVDFMYEFGDETRLEYIKPILYYHYNTPSTKVYMGAFPRRGLFELPFVMQADTFQYYRPNVEGIYVKLENSWGEQDAWLDWTSRQTVESRETFLIGGTGKAKIGTLFARYDFIMYHYAGRAEAEEPENVRDNGGLTVVIGANLSNLTPLDTLVLCTGFTGSYDRYRTLYDLQFTSGSISEIYTKYKRFGIKNTTYFGDGQVNLVGDQMYTAPFYNRTDFILNIFQKGSVKGLVEFSLHILPGITDYSQKFAIYLDISGRKKINMSSNTHRF